MVVAKLSLAAYALAAWRNEVRLCWEVDVRVIFQGPSPERIPQ
jgi:hypothetical protein